MTSRPPGVADATFLQRLRGRPLHVGDRSPCSLAGAWTGCLASDDFMPAGSRHEERLPGACAGPSWRSGLRPDFAALLGPGVRGRTRCAPAALRSDSARESVDEARCARHPRPCGARRHSMGRRRHRAAVPRARRAGVRTRACRIGRPAEWASRVPTHRRRPRLRSTRPIAIARRAHTKGSCRCIAVVDPPRRQSDRRPHDREIQAHRPAPIRVACGGASDRSRAQSSRFLS